MDRLSLSNSDTHPPPLSAHFTASATSSSQQDIQLHGIGRRSNDDDSVAHNVVQDRAPSDRSVRRVLWGKHVFMITVSAVLNIGFYIRSGTVLRTAGPLALFLSFSILTSLAWGVMQCITEMLAIWPVPGALVEFVRVFVDEDLALTVGVAYWFTYSITFAAIITAIAGDVAVWSVPKGIDGGVLFSLVPLVLICINSLGVRLYGFIELVGGTTKLVLAAAVVLICMPIINSRSASGVPGDLDDQFWNNGTITTFDGDAADHWSIAFFISLSLAVFAFVGVEIPAATALEARILPSLAGRGGPIDRSVRFSAIWVSIIVGLIYILGALMVSFNLYWKDSQLPRLSWLASSNGTGGSTSGSESSTNKSNCAFVIAADNSAVPGHQVLADFINACILITALTAANTTIYVASRTLFSLTKGIQANASSPWILRFLSYFGHTNHRRVPMRALAASCCFCWVPFLYLSNSHAPGTTIGALLDVLADMGSVSCIAVWAVECVAFIRFYRCLKRHRTVLEELQMPFLRRFYFGDGDDYPYRSHGQPFTAIASLSGCLFILIVADGAALWKKFRPQPFLSAYLSPIFFMVLLAGIKLYRGNSWTLVDLSQADTVINSMRRLDRLRWRNTANEEEPAVWYNLWGWFEQRDNRDNRSR